MKRIVLAKLGLDGHDVGVRLIGKHLMENGFEVIYLGKRVSTNLIVQAALQEDAAAIGLSCLSGGLGYFATRTLDSLNEQGADIPVLAGGIDEPAELEKMLQAGVGAYFGPGTPIEDIVRAFEDAIADDCSVTPLPQPASTRRRTP
ncbi:cobalamin B12-binding domain-containing protein [Sciscionella marina]|uniref:cobalamin B12-binding domain-containing protein n=1 Tax=Sciscionella marina TaxID=508770 RepID=UPI00035EB9CC|nr:cobalamin-dependent protein [Sciscionella marina]